MRSVAVDAHTISPGRGSTALRVAAVVASLSTTLGCPSEADGPEDVALVETERVRASVVATAGGVVEGPRGARLVIPPGALAEDTTVVMTPLRVGAGAAMDVFGGVELLPHGLAFAAPASLTIPLAQALPRDTELRRATDPTGRRRFGDTGELFVVDASGLSATGSIEGFSSDLVMKSCHAGTRDTMLRAWAEIPERTPSDVAEAAGISEHDLRTCDLRSDPLGRILAAYFGRAADLPADVAMTAQTHAAIRDAVERGLQVVLLFGRSIEGSTEEPTGVAHSAVVVEVDGRLVVRSQLNVTDAGTFERLEERGGSTTLDVPLDELDAPGTGLRDMRAGEVLSLLFGRALSDRDRRARVWPHVVVYVERPRDGGPPPCETAPITVVNATDYESWELTVTAEHEGASITLIPGHELRRFQAGDTVVLAARTACITNMGECLDTERHCRVWGPDSFVLACEGVTYTVSGNGQLSPTCE
ncbi:MAG: hypothetical protein IT379_19580 [Deltaproteobacteria bacterium]|nr:hypothetical protein [Deltaproteobacteria bacterium]